MAKQSRVLFFVDGDVPSEAEQEAMKDIDGQVCARNAHYIRAEEALEDADAVSGTVPTRYLEAVEPDTGKARYDRVGDVTEYKTPGAKAEEAEGAKKKATKGGKAKGGDWGKTAA